MTHCATWLGRCKARLDCLVLDLAENRAFNPDLKIVSSVGSRFVENQFMTLGYWFSAAFYRRAVKAIFKVEPMSSFIFVEQEHPFDMDLVGLTPEYIEIGDECVERMLREYAKCEASGTWPKRRLDPNGLRLLVPPMYLASVTNTEIRGRVDQEPPEDHAKDAEYMGLVDEDELP